MAFENLIFSDSLFSYFYFFISYAVLGGGVKYIDDAFDENTFNKTKAMLLAPVLGIFWAFNMSLSAASCTILLAIVLGVLFKGKIDVLAHKIGVISIVVVVVLSGYFEVLWIPLIIITFFGVIDEVGNDWVDRENIYNKFLPFSKYVHLFFQYRFSMKLITLAFAVLGYYDYLYFVAFLGFDIAYALIDKYSARLIHERKFFYNGQGNTIGG